MKSFKKFNENKTKTKKDHFPSRFCVPEDGTYWIIRFMI